MTDRVPFLDRIAGAPITWGVDGSPGWGHLMDRDRVMSEMAGMGLAATELGPDGYLPTDSDELTDYLRSYDLRVVGGFVPALLYRPAQIEEELAYVTRAARQLAGAGSETLVLGPSSHYDGYDKSVDMTEPEWSVFLSNLTRLEDIVESAGLHTALHPHWGMAVQSPDQIDRLLETSDVGICLDTGHIFLGGGDPAELAKTAADRVLHVHLKDMTAHDAEAVRNGEVPFRQSVIDGMFVPLGEGDIPIEGVIRALERSGFQGWYVLEQDKALSTEPEPGGGPETDARASVAFLEMIEMGDP